MLRRIPTRRPIPGGLGIAWIEDEGRIFVLAPIVLCPVLRALRRLWMWAKYGDLVDRLAYSPGPISVASDAAHSRTSEAESAELKSKSAQLDPIEQFLEDLTGGEITGHAPSVAASADVFELYQAWCRRRRIRPCCLRVLVARLKSSHTCKIHASRQRYAETGRIRNAASLLWFGGIKPPDTDLAAWLGEHVTAFRSAARAFGRSAT